MKSKCMKLILVLFWETFVNKRLPLLSHDPSPLSVQVKRLAPKNGIAISSSQVLL